MKLEQQVCSLELAKKLKELGVKQESYAHWGYNDDKLINPKGEWKLYVGWQPHAGYENGYREEYIAAFTVAELSNWLILNDNNSDIDERLAELRKQGKNIFHPDNLAPLIIKQLEHGESR